MYLANRERKFCPFPGARASGGTPRVSDHDPQCGIDDVIRRALDEGRVLLDGNRDWLLQFVLAIHHLRRLVNDRHDFFFLISIWPYWTRGKTHGEQGIILFTGLERPPRFRWQRSGVAPAHSGVLPASKLNVAPCATSMLPTTSRHPGGDANGDGEGYVCLSRTRHRGEGSLPLGNCVPAPGKSRKIRAGRACVAKTPAVSHAP